MFGTWLGMRRSPFALALLGRGASRLTLGHLRVARILLLPPLRLVIRWGAEWVGVADPSARMGWPAT